MSNLDEEEKNLELALKLSLQEFEEKSKPVATEPKSKTRQVMALFDFEAVEENELTIRTGDIMTITNDSNEYWYEGFNQNGESGFFPSNFVTFNFPEHVSQSVTVEIDPSLMDKMVELIENSDPTTDHNTPEFVDCKKRTQVMEQMIETEITAIDIQLSLFNDLAQNFYNLSLQYSEASKNEHKYNPSDTTYLSSFRPHTSHIKQNFPQSVNMHQNVPQSVNMHQNVPQSVNMHQNVPQSVNMYQNVPQSVNMYQNVPQSVNMYQNVPKPVNMCHNIPLNLNMFPDSPQIFLQKMTEMSHMYSHVDGLLHKQGLERPTLKQNLSGVGFPIETRNPQVFPGANLNLYYPSFNPQTAHKQPTNCSFRNLPPRDRHLYRPNFDGYKQHYNTGYVPPHNTSDAGVSGGSYFASSEINQQPNIYPKGDYYY